MAVPSSPVFTPAQLATRLLGIVERISHRVTTRDVHQLRTTARRLEVQLGFTSKKLAKALQRLRRRAGRIRDLDVHRALLAHPEKLAAEEVTSKSVTDTMAALRNPAASQNHTAIQRQRSAQRQLRLTRRQFESARLQLLAVLGRRRVKAARELRPMAIQQLPRLSTLLSAAVALAAAAPVETQISPAVLDNVRFQYLCLTREIPRAPAAFHRLRIQVKKLRYAIEPLALQSESANLVAQCKQVQDAIGLWHDWATLVSLAEKLIDPEDSGALCEALAGRTRRQHRRARRIVEETRRTIEGTMSSSVPPVANAPAGSTAAPAASIQTSASISRRRVG